MANVAAGEDGKGVEACGGVDEACAFCVVCALILKNGAAAALRKGARDVGLHKAGRNAAEGAEGVDAVLADGRDVCGVDGADHAQDGLSGGGFVDGADANVTWRGGAAEAPRVDADEASAEAL